MKSTPVTSVICFVAGFLLASFLYGCFIIPGKETIIQKLQVDLALHPATVTNIEYWPLSTSPNLPTDMEIESIKLPIATTNDLQKDKIVSKIVFVSQIPAANAHLQGIGGNVYQISGKTFLNCYVIGPAIIAFSGDLFMFNCHLDSQPGTTVDAHLLLMQSRYLFGAIPFHDCTFDGCHFEDIGFAGTQEELDNFRKNFADNNVHAP